MSTAYAEISSDGLYRYTLGRRWSNDPTSPVAVFVMLNPSTADVDHDDPTIRRCIGFAKALDCGSLHVVNLYAFRATKPANLWLAADPIGPSNDDHLSEAARLSHDGSLIAAWGANARPDRIAQVRPLLGERLTALGVTKAGQPRHPLYLPSAARPTPWVGAA